MFNLENQIAAIGCSIAVNLTETANQMIQCESEGFVLLDVVGVTANPRIREPQYFISVLTNYSGAYRCIITLSSDCDLQKVTVMFDGEVDSDATINKLFDEMCPLISDVIALDGAGREDAVANLRTELAAELGEVQ